MQPNIIITDVEIENEIHKQIMISGAANEEEARDAAEEWCDEHNCLLLDFIRENQNAASNGENEAYYAIVGEDDYT